jgi:heavy metal efflux system protein
LAYRVLIRLIAIIEHEKFQKTVEYFEKTALNNSTLISTTAQQQLVNGSINYLEWVTLINQATAIRNDYIEAIKNLNESAIQINYLVNY